MEFFRPTPALFPELYQDAADTLKEIFNQKIPDSIKLIELISKFNQDERVEIASIYGSELLFEQSKKAFKSDFENLILALFTPRYQVFANLLNTLFKRPSTLLTTLAFCISTPDAECLLKVQNFASLYEQNFGKLGPAFLTRKEDCSSDILTIRQELDKSSFESTLIHVLSNLHFSFYQQFILQNPDINEKIKCDISKNYEAYISASDAKNDMFRQVAKCVKLTVKGLGTKDDELIGLTAIFGDRMRNQIIKKSYDGDIVKELKSDLSGDYERCILAVWGLK
ncbi:Annexin [Spironucleus salmonicida]|uniref:Annexin n=1 Tax=Spironucleus salmonicida TaxID=348837 RepID=V6LT38_9EUKA|nr:Annexin [Spironucleus salmonicida]|eukprot:EST47740.1 Annexin [Spironucleus salmonicida]